MAVLARKIVASETSRRIRNRWTDLIRGIREKRIPVFNKCAERIVRDRSDIGRRPLGEIDVAAPRDRPVRARYRGRDAKRHSEQKEPRVFHSALSMNPRSAKLASADAGENDETYYSILSAWATGYGAFETC